LQFPPEIHQGDIDPNNEFALDMGLDLLDLANLPDPLNSNSSFTNLTNLGPPPSTRADTSNVGINNHNGSVEGFPNGLAGFGHDGNDFMDLDMGLADLMNDGAPVLPDGNGLDEYVSFTRGLGKRLTSSLL